jgi:hypothetical protein
MVKSMRERITHHGSSSRLDGVSLRDILLDANQDAHQDEGFWQTTGVKVSL